MDAKTKEGHLSPTGEGVQITWKNLTQRDPGVVTIPWDYLPLVIESLTTLSAKADQYDKSHEAWMEFDDGNQE